MTSARSFSWLRTIASKTWLLWFVHLQSANASCHTYGSVMSHVSMSHVIHMDKLCNTFEWVMSLTRRHTHGWVLSYMSISYVTRINEKCDFLVTFYGPQRLTLVVRGWMDHVTHLNESCHGYKRVISCTWMSHVARTQESWHTHKWVMAHTSMSHGTYTSSTWHL